MKTKDELKKLVNKVFPNDSNESKKWLVETLSPESRIALLEHNNKVLNESLDITEPLAYQRVKSIQNLSKAGYKGGKISKRKPWAEAAAQHLANISGKAAPRRAWPMIPDAKETDEWTFELSGEYDVYVYRDDDALIAVNTESRSQIGAIKKETFFKKYYKKN